MKDEKPALKEATIHVRVTPEDKALLIKKASNASQSLGAYARDQLLKGQVVLIQPADRQQLLALEISLAKIGSNLNQLAKVANSNGQIDGHELDALKSKLKNLTDGHR